MTRPGTAARRPVPDVTTAVISAAASSATPCGSTRTRCGLSMATVTSLPLLLTDWTSRIPTGPCSREPSVPLTSRPPVASVS